jgi:CubicO group peptidase (beta-lactamase class C family)/pimeloyl-ACP methyl ester carboxylesterase
MSTISYPIKPKSWPWSMSPFVHSLLFALVWLFFGLLVALLTAPVLLVFVATAIPRALSIGLAVADVTLLLAFFRFERTWRTVSGLLLGVLAVSTLAVWLSQAYATTPPIVDAAGKPIPNSIATLEKVTLGGSEQWITIRGKDVTKPVLLYLGIGGPGAGGFPATALTLAPLEDHFVVVNWDQPGTGKSYHAVPIATLTVERVVEDAHELTQRLRTRFQQDKIYVMGLSWGTIVGTKLVQKYPDLYAAYVGTGQMVNTTENDQMAYAFALQDAAVRGDTDTVTRLRRNGPPPYDGAGMATNYAAFLDVGFRYMESPTIPLIVLLMPQFAHEYGLVDRVNFGRGLLESFTVLYPQLKDLDFTTQAPKLDVPVYFLAGRKDVNAWSSLVERYYNVLQAPHKELIWLESGHGATAEEILDVMVNTVLAQTSPKAQPLPVPTGGPTDPQEVEAFLDELIPLQLHQEHIAGAAVAVVKAGQLLFAKGYGFADLATGRPVVADQTLLHTDSTGKLFVWTAVMQLAEAGKVDLDADINHYLDFQIPATFPQAITLKHLMSHSAGFEDTGALFALDVGDLQPVGTWLARHLPARVRPSGVVAGYSNYGTALAGYSVERVSGMPFDQYVEEHIFQPLGMAHSTLHQPIPAALAADLTTNYRYSGDNFNALPTVYVRAPAGEAHTTVTDMAKFMIAHLQSGDSPILQASTAQQMHSQLFAHDPGVSGMAYGFAETTQNGLHLLRHEGNLEGVSSSALFLAPEQELGVYIAYNSNGGFGPGETFRRAFLDHYFPVQAAPPQAISLTAEETNQLVGAYRSTRMFETAFAKVLRLLGGGYGDVQVRANADGTFTTQGIGSATLHWVPVAPKMLRLADGAQNGSGDLVFGADEQGQRTRLFVGNNPYRAYEKVAWYEGVDLHLLWLALCELAFLGLLIALPLGWLVRRIRGTQRTISANRVAQWLLVSACALAVIFPLGLLLTMEGALLYGVTPALIAVLSLPLIAIAFAAASLCFAWRNWRQIPVRGRVPYGVLLVTMVAFVSWLHVWNLLGFRL